MDFAAYLFYIQTKKLVNYGVSSFIFTPGTSPDVGRKLHFLILFSRFTSKYKKMYYIFLSSFK